MTFVARSVRYVLRKRVRTIVLLIVLTIITASMLSTIAVSRAAQQAAGRIEKEAVGGFVLSSNMQGSMLTPRGGGMVRPADVRRIAQLPGVDSYMVRQNATADLVGANVAKVPGGDDYDATQEQQFGNAANVMGTNDSSKLNVFTSRTLGMAEGRHLKASDKYTSMIHEDLAKANGLKVGDTLTLKANAYDADNESHSTATVKTTIVGIFKGDSARKVSSRAELTANTIYTDLDTTRDLYQYKDGKEIYQDATFVLSKGVDVEKTMDAARKLPVDWNNYQITRNDQYSSSMLHAARGVRSMMRGALIGVTVSAVLVLSLMLLLWMNDRRQEMGILVSLGVGKPSLVAQYLTEMVLIGLPSTGVHSNGFSLVRKALFEQAGYTVDTQLDELGGEKLGDVLLTPTKIYVKTLSPLFKAGVVKGVAHITGGGFIENIPRMIPDGLAAHINLGSWPVLPIFDVLEKAGNIDHMEMFNIFNMGIGMVLAIDPARKDEALKLLADNNEPAYVLGSITADTTGTQIVLK